MAEIHVQMEGGSFILSPLLWSVMGWMVALKSQAHVKLQVYFTLGK